MAVAVVSCLQTGGSNSPELQGRSSDGAHVSRREPLAQPDDFGQGTLLVWCASGGREREGVGGGGVVFGLAFFTIVSSRLAMDHAPFSIPPEADPATEGRPAVAGDP